MAPMRCSICGRQFDPENSTAMPFCSERCRSIDRLRWLNEQYGLPYESEPRLGGDGGGDADRDD
jgi:endogenous inhibitor of DNA gyrase (YacG/DUF329 family)